MSFLAENLLQSTPFNFKTTDIVEEQYFYKSVLEELSFHYENNEMYRSFCINKGFNPKTFNGTLDKIPPIQVSVFKELGKELSSVSKKDIKVTLQSSATSGVPSSIIVDSITSKRQTKAMIKVVGDFIGNERKPFLIMDVDPSQGFQKILGARYAAVSGFLNFASKVGYFLKIDENGICYFDIDGIKNFIAELCEPVVVFGFTYILYSEVVKPLLDRNVSFNLPYGSKVIHIGGWKKLEHNKVDKETFNRYTAKLFGLKPCDVIDIYGFTEQMGLNYPDCLCGMKHTSIYSDVIVRDVITKDCLPCGQIGLLEFISPIPHSYPGNVVLTDDIGMLVDGECPYGRGGKRFKILGRLKKAEVRGCGDILSNKLKFYDENKTLIKAKTTDFNYFFFDNVDYNNFSPIEIMKDISNKLRKNLEWIRIQPIDAIIGLIAKISKKWLNTANLLQNQNLGVNFLVSWCSPEHLTKVANEGLRGNKKFSDTFLPYGDSNSRSLHAVSKGLVCHWLAGNVPVLGMYVLIQSIISKNVNILRVSSRDNGVFKSMLLAFSGEYFVTKGGYTIYGDDLLKTIALVYYPHTNDSIAKLMSSLADVRVAWGGAEAVSTVAAYPSNFDCEDIIMGPKLSFSVVSRETIPDLRKAQKLARKIAIDASVFDQTGCASTHNVFVEESSVVSSEKFAELLSNAMEKVSKQIPKGKMTPEEISSVHSVRELFDFKGKFFGDEDYIWTVLYSKKLERNKPIYSRVVFVHPISDVLDVIPFIDEYTQTIGLSIVGDKAIDFALKASEKGVNRFPVCGRMLNFESPWDGIFIIDRLVRWVTLGGPLL